MTRDAVVLAAGKGTRLASGEDIPKPLQRVAGTPLIKRTLLALADGGVTRVVVVTGHQAELVRDALTRDPDYAARGLAIEFAHNAEYEKSNGISVIVGGRACAGPFFLSMADHIYPAAVVRMLAAQDLTAADLYLATDPRLGDVLDIVDATKVRSEDGRIVEIGKTIATYDRIDCGVFVVSQALVAALEQLRTERGDCSLSHGVQRLAEQRRARIADIGDLFWQDVDTPADQAYAERKLRD